jgi:hypothetical protein
MMRVHVLVFAILSILFVTPTWAAEGSFFVPEIIAVTNHAQSLYGQPLPGKITRVISSKDEIALFFVSMRAVGDQTQTHKAHLDCVDSEGQEIISKELVLEIPSLTTKEFMGAETGYIETYLALNPKRGAKVKGQKRQLIQGSHYYFRLFIDGQLKALTSFHYMN